jgi:phospholipid/cholesterol/gamma-HCH transport system ATP-binding protein
MQLQRGHCNLIIGSSGSGKTVLLKSIVGLVKPDAGQVLLDGRDWTGMPERERKVLRQEMGMVFQASALFTSLTVEENVRFPLDFFSTMPLSEKNARIAFCLDRVRIPQSALRKNTAELSGGMQKRVAIARAIALNPKYLFCDEPNSGLDPQTSLVVDKLIMEITKEYNITTIMNTHDMNSVMESGDKIIFLYQGEKRWEGSKEDIIFSKDEKLNNFIFASEFLQEAKKMRMMVPK